MTILKHLALACVLVSPTLAHAAQTRSKHRAVLETLARIGKIEVAKVTVAETWSGESEGYRTRARFAYQALESFDHTGPDFAALRDFRARRYPGFDMVLAGDDMPAIEQAITEIKNPGDDHFPRSRLFDLLRDPAVEKTLGLSRPVRDALGALRALSKGAQFYHLAELWDYI